MTVVVEKLGYVGCCQSGNKEQTCGDTLTFDTIMKESDFTIDPRKVLADVCRGQTPPYLSGEPAVEPEASVDV